MKTTATLWTPTLLNLPFDTFDDWASPDDVTAAADNFPDLCDALLDAHAGGGWDQPAVIYAVGRAAAPFASANSATGTGDLVAVRLPDRDLPNMLSTYHLLAGLNLAGWDGVVTVTEVWMTEVRAGAGDYRREGRAAYYATSAGGSGGASRYRTRDGETASMHGNVGGPLFHFLRASLGIRFRAALDWCVAAVTIDSYVNGEHLGPFTALADTSISDSEAVEASGLADGMLPEVRDLLFPRLAGSFTELQVGCSVALGNIAVTPDMLDWLGLDFFRIGALNTVDRNYLVRVAWLALQVADPDSQCGQMVLRRALRADFGTGGQDPGCVAGQLAVRLFSPEGITLVSQGSMPGQSAAERKMWRAVRTLFAACDPTSPEVPMFARRLGLVQDACEGRPLRV